VWLGLGTEIIPSNDYNPLLPWFGYVLLGIAVARVIPPEKWPRWRPHSLAGRTLCLAGRHSLIVYLVHQPLLMAALWLVAQVLR
jgi:uncharacterized membrane protein